jgi:hypothetical protein
VEVPSIYGEHLADEGELVPPEVEGCGGREMSCCTCKQPGAVVPDPVAFGILLQEREEEVEIFADEEGDFLLGGSVIRFRGGGDVARFQ